MKPVQFPTPLGPKDEIAALVATMAEAERRLEEITGGEVDTVMSRSGSPFVLRRAQEELRQIEFDRQASILNSLPAHVALLDAAGVIVTVNETWRQFALANHFLGAGCGVGVNYLTVCDEARGGNALEAPAVAQGIRSVLDGGRSFSLEYPCHSPTEQRWFHLTASPLSQARSQGVVIMHVNITTRKLAEQALRDSQTTMAAAQQIGHFGSWEVDLNRENDEDRNLLRWSDEMFHIAGYEPGAVEITNRFFFTLIPVEEHALIRDTIAGAIRVRKPYTLVHRLIRADGSVRFLQEQAKIFFDETSGRPVKIIGTAHDITERMQADAARHQQQTELRALVDLIPAMIWFKDTKNRILRVNQRVADSVQMTIAEIEGKPTEDIYPQEAAGFYADDLAVMRSGTPKLGYVEMMSNPAGRKLWVQTDKVPVRDKEGKISGIIVMAQDVTERREALEALRESEARFKALFEQAAVGVALTEAMTGRFVQANQRFADIAGRSREELEQLTFVAITHPQDVPHDLEAMRQMRAGTIREFTREKRYVLKNGTERWVNLTVSAMWMPGDAPGLCIVMVQDITGRKQLEEQVRQSQKMDAIGTLAGGIAHDFNNILAAINGYTELAELKLKDNPEVRKFLGAVLKASSRATDLIRQILAFSRQEPVKRLPIRLHSVVAESLALLRATLPSTIEFDTSLATDAPTVLADATQIHQILMNLGTNAWHAMKDRPGRLQVKLERCAVDAAFAATQPRLRVGIYTRITVGDTGTGMDLTTQRRLFEPFFTTKPPGEGTGLGMAVVHGIMDSHDGSITVNSQPGKGTVFQLYFPAHIGEATGAVAGAGAVPRGHGERILVVDDEEMIAGLLAQTLVVLNYETEFATQPLVALEKMRADPTRFALVITDQTMPGMTGLELAGQLRNLRSGLPIILMTGYSAALSPERLEAAGIHRLLLKPATVLELATAVHAALPGTR